MTFFWRNIRLHTIDTDPLDKRTVLIRIRNAVLNADCPRYNLWGI
jgi:hypothetical protein